MVTSTCVDSKSAHLSWHPPRTVYLQPLQSCSPLLLFIVLQLHFKVAPPTLASQPTSITAMLLHDQLIGFDQRVTMALAPVSSVSCSAATQDDAGFARHGPLPGSPDASSGVQQGEAPVCVSGKPQHQGRKRRAPSKLPELQHWHATAAESAPCTTAKSLQGLGAPVPAAKRTCLPPKGTTAATAAGIILRGSLAH